MQIVISHFTELSHFPDLGREAKVPEAVPAAINKTLMPKANTNMSKDDHNMSPVEATYISNIPNTGEVHGAMTKPEKQPAMKTFSGADLNLVRCG